VLDLYRALGQRGNEASTLNNVALEQINQGAYAEAIDPLVESAGIFSEHRRPLDGALGRSTTSAWRTTFSARSRNRSASNPARALELGRANYDESGESLRDDGVGEPGHGERQAPGHAELLRARDRSVSPSG